MRRKTIPKRTAAVLIIGAPLFKGLDFSFPRGSQALEGRALSRPIAKLITLDDRTGSGRPSS